jgi:ABC-type phosphate transport system substrate-binding protein
MKALTLAAALVTMVAAAPVFAADAQPGTETVAQSASMSGNMSMSEAQTVQPAAKSRAQVYQELLQAEKSGELQRLNSTLYAN